MKLIACDACGVLNRIWKDAPPSIHCRACEAEVEIGFLPPDDGKVRQVEAYEDWIKKEVEARVEETLERYGLEEPLTQLRERLLDALFYIWMIEQRG